MGVYILLTPLSSVSSPQDADAATRRQEERRIHLTFGHSYTPLWPQVSTSPTRQPPQLQLCQHLLCLCVSVWVVYVSLDMWVRFVMTSRGSGVGPAIAWGSWLVFNTICGQRAVITHAHAFINVNSAFISCTNVPIILSQFPTCIFYAHNLKV